MTVTKRLKNGLLLCLVLGLVSCDGDVPPPTSVLLGDGAGGSNGQLVVGSSLLSCCMKTAKGWYCPPSCLRNAWITSEEEAAALISWCYKLDPKDAKDLMHKKWSQ